MVEKYYNPKFSDCDDRELSIIERENKNQIKEFQEEINKLKDKFTLILHEKNYRKHYKTIDSLMEYQERLRKVIKDPKSSENKAEKAGKENIKIEKVIYDILQYGEFIDLKEE